MDLYMALAAMALYLLVALNSCPRSARDVRGISASLASTNCVIGAIQFARAGISWFSISFPDPIRASASGFYGYPNHLALFLEVGLLMGLRCLLESLAPWIKILGVTARPSACSHPADGKPGWLYRRGRRLAVLAC